MSSRESDICIPKSAYGLRNKILEEILSGLASIYDKKSYILRVSNPFGVDQLSLKRRGLVMSLIFSCFSNEKITIRSSGIQQRDYIYSNDLSEFIYAMSSKFVDNLPPVLNVCSGQSFNAHDVISIISNEFHRSPVVEFTEENLCCDVVNSSINNELLKQTLRSMDLSQLFLPFNIKIKTLVRDFYASNVLDKLLINKNHSKQL